MHRMATSTLPIVALLLVAGCGEPFLSNPVPSAASGGAAASGTASASGSGGAGAGGSSGSSSSGGSGAEAPAPTGNHLCSVRLGGPGTVWPRSLARDANSNVVVSGYFDGSVDFGGGPLSAPLSDNAPFVVVFGSDCSHKWSTHLGGPHGLIHASFTPDGDVVAAGQMETDTTIGGTSYSLSGVKDSFVVKWSATGDVLWSRHFGVTGGNHWPRAVAADPQGDVLVFLNQFGAGDFGLGLSSGDRMVLLKLSGSDGSILWALPFTAQDFRARSVTTDANGNVYVGGMFVQTLSLGGTTLTGNGPESEAYVAKFDAAGTLLWARNYGSSNGGLTDYVRGVAVDPAGQVWIAGRFGGAIDFGQGPLQSAGGRDMFAARLDPDGNPEWSARFGGPERDDARSIAVDAQQHVLLTGRFRDTIDFGGGPLSATAAYVGADDVFLVKLDADGSHLWSRSFGNDNDDEGVHVAVDPSGGIALVGFFEDSIDFGGGPLSAGGNYSLFLALFEP
jgi:hypothetical protein